MPDPAGAPEPAFEQAEASSVNIAVSRAMVQALKKYYGKGPIEAKSYFMDDLLVVAMRGGFTVAEETMLEAGRGDLVRSFRQGFQNEMAERLIATVEQITGRKVVTYQSQVLYEPGLIMEIFVFEDRLPADP